MKKILEPLLILVIISFTILPLIHKGYFPIHDDEQVGRLIEMDIAIKDLQIPPRWTPNLGFGYGYPLFNFYPPFIYYVGEVFHIAGVGYIDSIKIVYFLGFFLSAYFMYLFAKEKFGRSGGLIAATLYTYAPYKAVDAYVRGSLSEFFAFVFFPIIFYAFYKKNIILSSLTLAGLILTHNLTALIFFPFLLLYLFFLLIFQKDKISLAKNYFFSLVLSFGLSAYFTIPSLLEKSYTLVDKVLTAELADFRLHFVALRQLVNSPWGYGGSLPGLFDDMSFEIGKIHLFLIAIILLITIFLILKRNSKRQILLFYILLFAFSVFMTLTVSKPFWELLQPLWYLQFPWRFLGPASFFGSVLIGSVVLFIKNKNLKIILSSFIIFITIIFYKNLFVPQRYIDINDSFYNSKMALQWTVSRMSYEYVPKEVKTTKTLLGTTVPAIAPKDLPTEKVTFISGVGEITKQNIKSQVYNLDLNVKEEASVRLSTYAFPGWVAYLDGQKVSIDPNNDFHLITINNIRPGLHNLTVKFTNTPIRALGNLITLLSLFVIIGLTISKYVYHRSKNSK